MIADSPIFVAVVDRAGTIQFLNRTQPGHSLAESVGKQIYDFIDSEYHDVARTCLESVFRTGNRASYETVAAGANGDQAWYETHLGPVRNGDTFVSVALFSTEITNRKRAEAFRKEAASMLQQELNKRNADLAFANEQLEWEVETRLQGEQRFRQLVESANDLIWEMDRDGVYTYVSPRSKKLLGYEPEEMVGKTPFDFMPPKEAKRNRVVLEESVASGGSIQRFEVIRLHKDGRQLVHETSVSPITDKLGHCRGFRGVSRDITQRKEVEEALRREHQALKRTLNAHDRERQVIAYEIHDGLTQHVAAASMLLQSIDPKQQQDAPEEVAEVIKTVKNLLGESLAEARRLINGARPPILDELGIAAAVEHLAHEVTGNSGMEISIKNKIGFERFDGELENAVYRIVQESVTNARRHSKSDSIRIELAQPDGHIRVMVRDWGVGFDPSTTDVKCFGLAGIRERTRLLGGEVHIDSSPGEGTRVVVELPVEVGESGD